MSPPADAGSILLPLARQSIARALGEDTDVSTGASPEWLLQPAASYVTLNLEGHPRGRTGTLRPSVPLRDDVAGNAVGAALNDPCFSPLTRPELDAIDIEIAVLSEAERIFGASEHEVLAQLRTGADGLAFRYGHHSGNFLPEMWAQYPDPQEFLAWLKYKSGLPPDFWATDIELQRYTVTCWREAEH